MKLSWVLGVAMTIVISSATENGWGQMRERSAVPTAQQWRLEDLYPSDPAWKQAKDALAGRLDELAKFKGTLTQSGPQMLSCLTLHSEMSKSLERLHAYASMKSDQDTRAATYLALKQEVEQLATEFRTKASFIEPEVVTLERETIERFIASESGLKVYRLYLFDILRSKAHTLAPEEETILAHRESR